MVEHCYTFTAPEELLRLGESHPTKVCTDDFNALDFTNSSSAKTVQITYTEIDSVSFDSNESVKTTVPRSLHDGLIWARRAYDNDGGDGPGELMFASGSQCTPRNLFSTGAELLTFLGRKFHEHPSKLEWHVVHQQILRSIHTSNRSNAKRQSKFQTLMDSSYKRRRGAMIAGEEGLAEDDLGD